MENEVQFAGTNSPRLRRKGQDLPDDELRRFTPTDYQAEDVYVTETEERAVLVKLDIIPEVYEELQRYGDPRRIMLDGVKAIIDEYRTGDRP